MASCPFENLGRTLHLAAIFVTLSLISSCHGKWTCVKLAAGHLTCPEKIWHASDKRIGNISNADIMHTSMLLHVFVNIFFYGIIYYIIHDY